MVQLDLQSIAYEAKTLNLAKEGYTAFYVDGTNGLDIHDGGSWGQAFKTIQHAIDEASNWCKIFINAGTYEENVVVAKDGIIFEGQSRDTVKIAPSTGKALTISNPNFAGRSFSTVSNETDEYSTIISGRHCKLYDFGIVATILGGRGLHVNASDCELQSIYNSDAFMGLGIIFSSGIHNSSVRDSYLNLTHFSSYAIGFSSNAENIEIYDNVIDGCNRGINSSVGAQHNTIYHNNFISVAVPIYGPNNNFFENYYSNHTNVDDGTGVATEPYIYGSTIDHRPVVNRDGWMSQSLGNGGSDYSPIGKLQMAAKSITLSTGAVPQVETLFTVTGKIECYVIGYIDTTVTTAGVLTLSVGVGGTDDGLISTTTDPNLVAGRVWVDTTVSTCRPSPQKRVISDGADITHTVDNAPATGGAITYHCLWRPVSSDGNVVAV